MCGIVGYVGEENATPILIKGLKRLEYRGYDSSGVALMTGKGVEIVKTPGRVADLEQALGSVTLPSQPIKVGIAHTRWATHGAPSEENAHPHRVGGVTLVHNGIVENAHEEKRYLEQKGVSLQSQTDTEVIAGRIALSYRSDPVSAIKEGLSSLRGSWALGILFDDYPDRLYAVRKDSPLYIGIGKNSCVACSDLAALPSGIDRYLIPEEGEIVEIVTSGVTVWDENLQVITAEKEMHPVRANGWDAELGSYPHFMRKEMAEQAGVIAGLVGRNTAKGAQNIFKNELSDLSGIKRIYLVGCGSAMHAGMLGAGYIERFARIPASVWIASEFRYGNPIFLPGDLVIVISQSGETADSLAALRLARSKGARTVAVVNVPGSTMTREADETIYLHAGPEIAVATTKAFSAQVAVLWMLAIRLAMERGEISFERARTMCDELASLPSFLEKTETLFPQIHRLAKEYQSAEHCFFLGRGADYALSMEGALKLKEISYIHCEAYAAGELKHGTISLITNGTPCIAAACDGALFEKTISGVKEVRARGARVLLILRSGQEAPADTADEILCLPAAPEWLMPLVAVLCMQYLAYCVALLRGCDVDKPRNLAKSVTVE